MLLIFKPVMLLPVTCLGWSRAVADHSARLLRWQCCLETGLWDQALVLQCWACGRGTKVAATVVQKGMMLTQKGCKDKLLHTARSLPICDFSRACVLRTREAKKQQYANAVYWEALYGRRFSWVTAATTEQIPSLGNLCFLVAYGDLGLQRLEQSVVLWVCFCPASGWKWVDGHRIWPAFSSLLDTFSSSWCRKLPFAAQSHKSPFNLYFSSISVGKSLGQDCRSS